MKRTLLAILLLVPVFADAQIKINALPASSAVGSGDLTIDDQAGTTKRATFAQVLTFIQAGISVQCATLPALTGVITSSGCTTSWGATLLPAANLPALSGDVATSSGSAVTAIQAGAVTLADHANLAADTFIANATSSAAAPQAVAPLAAANLMGAQVSAFSAVTLAPATPAFGTYTNDGVAIAPGTVVWVYSGAGTQTCGVGTNSGGTGGATNNSAGACQGLWVVQSAAPWTRPINFPNGYVIAQNCQLSVFIQRGTVYQGHTFRVTTSSAITIGTSGITTSDSTLATATATAFGLVKVTDVSASGIVTSFTGSQPTTFGECASYTDTAAGLGNQGNALVGISGPCIVGDANGHIAATPNSQSGPAVTGTGCSLTAGGTDNGGSIVAAGVDTCTLAFGTAFTTAPNCTVGNVGATVAANLTALPTTAHAVFATVAAGTFGYHCY